LGIAVLGSLATAVYRSQVTANLPPNISTEVAHTVRETLGGAVAAAGQLPGPLGLTLLDAAYNAFVSGLQVISLIGAVVMLGLALLTVTMLRHVEIVGEAEETLELEPDGLVITAVAPQVSLIE
jgi:DHA2 family multidrug resistance protein-like MFS transporter